MSNPLDKFKQLAGEKVEEPKDEPKPIYHSDSKEEWDDVAEPFKEFEREEQPPSNFVKPPVNDRKAYDAKIEIIRGFLKGKASHLRLKIADSGSNAIIHQGSVNDAWARIDRKGNLRIYRTVLSRMLVKAGIVPGPETIPHPGA